MKTTRWQRIYESINDLPVDGIITYTQIESITDRSIDDVRVDFYRAVRELEVNNQRTMENVRNIGYRVVAANEHERLVRKDIKSIRRKSRRAQSKAVNVRRDELTVDERQKIDAMQLKLAQHAEMLNRLDSRTSRLEELTKLDRRQNRETSAEMAARLERLEEQIRNMVPTEE